MLNEYQTHLTRRRLSPNTVRLRMFYMLKFAAQTDLLTATIDDFEAYLAQHPDWSRETQNTAIATLRSFYRWAFITGHTETHLAADLLRVHVPRKVARIASEAAIRAGLERGSVAERAMILLGAECGLRLSEIASLHVDCRDGDVLTIIGKGEVMRRVIITPELGDLLDEIERTTMRWGYYFPGRSGGHMHLTTVWRHISEAVETNPHSLRHRAGTVVYRNTGRDIRIAQEFLGHASPETTAIYVHVELDDLRRAAQAARIAA